MPKDEDQNSNQDPDEVIDPLDGVADDGDEDEDAPKVGPHGFPENTSVKDMTMEQQAAYHKYHKRRAESDNKELRRQLAAAQSNNSQDVDDARAEGLAAGLAIAAASELSRLSGRSAEDLEPILTAVDTDTFVKDGALNVDAIAKVAALIAKDAGAPESGGNKRDRRSPNDLANGVPKGNKAGSIAASKAAALEAIKSQNTNNN